MSALVGNVRTVHFQSSSSSCGREYLRVRVDERVEVIGCQDVQDGPAELFPGREPPLVVGVFLRIGGGILGYRDNEVQARVKALWFVEFSHRVGSWPIGEETVDVVARLGEVEGGNPYVVLQVRHTNRIDDICPRIASSAPSTTPFT
jgi:hypothetical protein